MKRFLTILLISLVSLAGIGVSAQVGYNFWLSTEGAGVHITNRNYGPPPPPRHHHHRYSPPRHHHSKKAWTKYKKMQKARKKYDKARREYYHERCHH